MRFHPESGWWLPDAEAHLQQWMASVDDRLRGRLTYQRAKYEYALRKTQDRRLHAVDVGAYVGQWSWVMTLDFERVTAFEPVDEHADCWDANMAGVQNAILHRFALGADERWVSMVGAGTMKASVGGAPGPTKQRTLDSFGLTEVDLLKIDCEGYELRVLQGAVRTLLTSRPCVVVEQKESANQQRYGLGQTEAVGFLRDLGFRLRAELDGDYIMHWPRPKKRKART